MIKEILGTILIIVLIVSAFFAGYTINNTRIIEYKDRPVYIKDCVDKFEKIVEKCPKCPECQTKEEILEEYNDWLEYGTKW